MSRINQGIDDKIGKLAFEIRNQENDHIQKSQAIVEQKVLKDKENLMTKINQVRLQVQQNKQTT